jgi:HEAT repeat protein
MGLSLERNESGYNSPLNGRSVIYDRVDAALPGRDMNERLRAVVALGKIDDPRAVRPLMDLLGDREPKIRLAATIALGHLKSGRPVDELIERLRDQKEQDEIRKQAVRTLAAIRSTGAIQGLREFAQDHGEDETLRALAETMLKEITIW